MFARFKERTRAIERIVEERRAANKAAQLDLVLDVTARAGSIRDPMLRAWVLSTLPVVPPNDKPALTITPGRAAPPAP